MTPAGNQSEEEKQVVETAMGILILGILVVLVSSGIFAAVLLTKYFRGS